MQDADSSVHPEKVTGGTHRDRKFCGAENICFHIGSSRVVKKFRPRLRLRLQLKNCELAVSFLLEKLYTFW
jgi:hypothetical protein